MKRTTLLCLTMLVLGLHALAKDVTKATVGNIELNAKECTAVVEVLNKGTSDITGFVLSLDASYTSGKKDHTEHTEEYGPLQTAKNKALHPGEASRVFVQFNNPKNDVCLDVKAKVIVAVDADLNGQASDDAAYDRFVNERKSTYQAYQQSADAIKQAVDTTDTDGSVKATAALKETMVQRKIHNKRDEGPDNGFVSETVQQLEKVPQRAKQEGKSEKDVLREMLKDKQDRATLYANYGNIRREQ